MCIPLTLLWPTQPDLIWRYDHIAHNNYSVLLTHKGNFHQINILHYLDHSQSDQIFVQSPPTIPPPAWQRAKRATKTCDERCWARGRDSFNKLLEILREEGEKKKVLCVNSLMSSESECAFSHPLVARTSSLPRGLLCLSPWQSGRENESTLRKHATIMWFRACSVWGLGLTAYNCLSSLLWEVRRPN